jgi:hypothetical protein
MTSVFKHTYLTTDFIKVINITLEINSDGNNTYILNKLRHFLRQNCSLLFNSKKKAKLFLILITCS